MVDIFALAKASIETVGFELADKLNELTAIMIVGQITPEEYEQLAELAREHANAEADPSETNVLGALRTIITEIESINARIAKLEAANEEAPVEYEYPEWEPWNGQADSGYSFGARVTRLGIRYVSNYVGLNVWEPGLLGTEALWTVVE